MNDDRLGPYRLLRRLGEGGMGVVHLAVDPQGRQVAVKVLRAEVAGDEVARRRLSREVETMQRVRSGYIAEVLDADVTGHRPYIVTRYVPGRPLDEIVKDDGPLDLPALVKVAHGVASALAAVHSVGVIHRDLKPGNVLILDGEPVLIDFGIAQAVDATRLTQTGMFIGTPGYLAPEIIEGHEAGPEVDVHAWAGTLLFAASGQPPFGKGTLEMVFYNITAGKADIGAAPPELRPLLKAAFQRNPAKRPKAAELAEQTARMLPSKPPGRSEEITTVPARTDPPRPVPFPPPPRVGDKPPYDVSTPPMTPRRLIDGAEQPSAPGRPYESLLGGASRDQPYESLLPDQADPYPTRRVTPEELRRIQQRDVGPYAPPPAPANGPVTPPGESDVPTRRVRPEAPDQRRPGSPPAPQGSQPGPYPGSGPQAGGPGYQRPNPIPVQVPPYIPAQPPYQPDPPTQREPYVPGVQPGRLLQRSKAYGVASAMLLVLMIVAAVLAPVVVAVVAIPVAILLRAADMAQPQLTARRAAGAAALDLVRVFAFPAALARSAGITLALVLYALILGLPVTLLLTVVAGMDASYALAWGAAVALWTLCAGPGVEGPGKQMRRTLASLVPSRTAAMVLAGVLAAGAGLSLVVAASTFGDNPRGAVWTPLNVDPIIEQLAGLRESSGG
ncbi:serine/threonine-protein kinase [Nonomuraea terrae]|uniref:serine/threonine-protein kinase n=1 Tax=Nonomuraea terrae TaxID=2530383 RepID=UPI001CB748A7|nr:serine/threonine-protein kinase [Nonomuraea terrae]